LTRDLKQILAAAVEMTKDPGTAERLLQAAERAESATERYMAEQHELACMKSEHKQFLARAGKEHDERIALERAAWDRELQERKRRLQQEEDEVARRREAAGKDRELAAALRDRMERKAGRAGIALAPDESTEQVLPAGCDSVIEQQPAV
jgi:hypothetical protein